MRDKKKPGKLLSLAMNFLIGTVVVLSIYFLATYFLARAFRNAIPLP